MLPRRMAGGSLGPFLSGHLGSPLTGPEGALCSVAVIRVLLSKYGAAGCVTVKARKAPFITAALCSVSHPVPRPVQDPALTVWGTEGQDAT